MKKLHNILIIFILIVANACVDPIQVELNKGTENLVVEGLITDQPGPYYVNLSISRDYKDATVSKKPNVSNAIITISDDAGNAEILTQIDSGRYATKVGGIQGTVGRKYKINIQYNGNEYESVPDQLTPVPEIKKIISEYKKWTSATVDGIYTSVEVADPSDERNFYRWKYTGHQEYQRIYSDDLQPDLGERALQCISTETSNAVNIISDKFTNGQNFSQQLLIIPYTSRNKYLLRLEQYSLSRTAFEFWQEVQSQSGNQGSLFDPPPQQVKGNIANLNNDKEVVLGYFGASGARIEIIAVQRDNIPYDITSHPPQPLPCTAGPMACALGVVALPKPPCPNEPPTYWYSGN